MRTRRLIGSVLGLILLAVLTPGIAVAVATANTGIRSPHDDSRDLHCSDPTPADVDACRQMEQRILSATVRIRIESWIVKAGECGYKRYYATGHGTVMAGRYLVTHNHYHVPLSIRPVTGQRKPYSQIILYDCRGKILVQEPLSRFELVWEDPQTVVLAYQDGNLFTELGLVSAAFGEWSSIPFETGMELAQVDWDGNGSRVDWVTVQAVDVEGDVPQLVLSDGVTVGASGGGIFWQGVHIGNNWLLLKQKEASGFLVESGTIVALNSADVAGQAAPSELERAMHGW